MCAILVAAGRALPAAALLQYTVPADIDGTARAPRPSQHVLYLPFHLLALLGFTLVYVLCRCQ